MIEFFQVTVTVVFFLIVWKVVRTIAKYIDSVISLKENQNEMLEVLEEIKNELKELNKNNSERNYKS